MTHYALSFSCRERTVPWTFQPSLEGWIPGLIVEIAWSFRMKQKKSKISSCPSYTLLQMSFLTHRLPISFRRRSLCILISSVDLFFLHRLSPERNWSTCCHEKSLNKSIKVNYRLFTFHTCYLLCNTDIDMTCKSRSQASKMLGHSSPGHGNQGFTKRFVEIEVMVKSRVFRAKEEGGVDGIYHLCRIKYIMQIV